MVSKKPNFEAAWQVLPLIPIESAHEAQSPSGPLVLGEDELFSVYGGLRSLLHLVCTYRPHLLWGHVMLTCVKRSFADKSGYDLNPGVLHVSDTSYHSATVLSLDPGEWYVHCTVSWLGSAKPFLNRCDPCSLPRDQIEHGDVSRSPEHPP